MYLFFLCKANIIDWKVKPKNRLFSPFFHENVRIRYFSVEKLRTKAGSSGLKVRCKKQQYSLILKSTL
ncbi:hypothetical protein CBW18_00435 [Pedobacter sp. AJM]|nr:hypothetical protein CBW18_00435 [Pedobacter sp. AJM]